MTRFNTSIMVILIVVALTYATSELMEREKNDPYRALLYCPNAPADTLTDVTRYQYTRAYLAIFHTTHIERVSPACTLRKM